ncbi:MAG: class I SAM-dependent methyltransferase [Planctomycetes bacterium]|nr:class I SAM-dependent methyltransferase [Planctomycetota bacterium]
MSIDSKSIKKFWDNRAQQYEQSKSLSVTNLEEDEELQQLKVQLEHEHIFRLLKIAPNMQILDLGAGIGAWSAVFASKCKKVVAVEYSENMLEIARQTAKEDSVNNIDFICQDVLEFRTEQKFDVIFCSGLLLYLDDSQVAKLLLNIKGHSKKDTVLLLREPAGINGRYEIIDKYSEALKASYSALYRTNKEYITMFNQIGYSIVCDEDMFEEGSPLNKWEETRLRLYLFQYRGD